VTGNALEVSDMGKRIGLLYRAFGALVVAATLLASAPQGALADKKSNPNERTVTGTVYSHNEEKSTIILVTGDLGTKNQPITIDMRDFKGTFRSVDDGQSLSLLVIPRQQDSWLMTGFVSEGSYVHRDDLGVQERYETLDSSIKAHVGNVPEDDEALNQQHRDNDLRRKEEEAKGNQNGSK
jgi:hypothetical protein